MSRSVARQVALGGASVLAATLLLVGTVTLAIVHAQQVAALDRALLAAAFEHAHPEVDADVEVDAGVAPIEAWLVEGDDPRVPAALAEQALDVEAALYADVGADRVVVLSFEVERAGASVHRLAAASAPRMTLARSVGGFAAAYTLVALLAALAASIVLGALVRRAFVPLERSREEVARVVGLGEGARLTVAGPAEVRELLEAVNALLGRLEAAHNTQIRFTAEAAHELRTPVAAMLGELDVALRRAPLDAEATRVLRSVREEAERLRRLVDGLTALARLDAGASGRGRELVRAAELVASVLRREGPALAAAGCTVQLLVDDDPEVEVQRPLLESALGNLMRNVARHAPGTAATVRVRRVGGALRIEVDDAGPGLSPELRATVFDRFARGGVARREDPEGLGLGLPIAREVARRHGGDCTLEASPDGGVRAVLTLAIG